MPSLRPFVLSTLLAAFFICSVDSASIQRRDCEYSCPATDVAHYPLGTGSGVRGGVLFCAYPFLSHCSYSATDGTLIEDLNSDLCDTSADCSASECTCPSTDIGQYPLGPGSAQFGSVLICTYPTEFEVIDTSSYCEYSVADASQVSDNDHYLCPLNAVQEDCSTLRVAAEGMPAMLMD